ncbi:tetratricopeptide repeat protein [Hamadaea sp. NPDC050747]|uniref:tetratricopeptide repeat protein n=1 Tax=Hamadaea sp. NPDC050747 TaxID=3155789 RepID=UPI0033C47BC9
MTVDHRLDQARIAYEKGTFAGDVGDLAAAERALDSLEADTALARGRLLNVRFFADRVEDPREMVLFEQAAARHAALGDQRGEGEALFWIGIVHQVVRDDGAAAVPLFERSLELARATGDKLTQSYALRHLGVVAHAQGRVAEAREFLEQSSALRRELGFLSGVAANMVGLAYLALGDGRRDDALSILDDAETLARDSGADEIARQVTEARTAATAS